MMGSEVYVLNKGNQGRDWGEKKRKLVKKVFDEICKVGRKGGDVWERVIQMMR